MKNKYSFTVLSYLKFFRIKEWFYIIGLAYLGLFFGLRQFSIKDFFILSVMATLYLAHGYSINNYFDLKHEKPDALTRYGEYFNPKTALYISVILYLINIFLSFFYSKAIFILIALGGVVSFLYSSSLFRLKENPLWNIILNSTGFSIIFLIGYLINKRFELISLSLTAYIWMGIIPSQIIHLLAHQEIRGFSPLPSLGPVGIFYLSLLTWIFCTIILFYREAFLGEVILFTSTFCVLEVSLIELFQCRNKFTVDKMLKIRNAFRWVNVIFGIRLFILFLNDNMKHGF